MNREAKATTVSIFVCATMCLISLTPGRAQESGSSHFGAGTQHSFSSAGAAVPAQSVGASGSSTWGAGKGSFKSSAQPGGIWSDGSTLSASPGASHRATQVLTPAAGAPAFGAVRPGSSSASKARTVRGNTAPGMANLSHSSSDQRFGTKTSSHSPISGPSGMSHPVGGSRGRVGSLGRSTGRGKAPASPGLTSRMAQHPSTLKSSPSSSLKRGLDTGPSKTGVGVQP